MSVPSYNFLGSPAIGKILVTVPVYEALSEEQRQAIIADIRGKLDDSTDMPIELSGPSPDFLEGEDWNSYAFRVFGEPISCDLRKDRDTTGHARLPFVPASVLRDAPRRTKR